MSKQRPSVFALRLAIAAFWAFAPLMAIGDLARAAPAAAGPAFQTIAPYAILMDADSGAVLFEKNADDLVAPASTAKIMTADIVFKQVTDGLLTLDDRFVVSENAWRHGGAPSHGSAMFAAVNSRVRIEDLLRGLVIDSGNDAAIALAEGIAGTEDAFATMMTARARELGLSKSTFTNAWGRDDPGQKVTAREMARLAIHVITTYPQLYRYFGEKEFTWNKVRQTNRNPLLTMDIGADGLRTGENTESGYGLVGSAVQNGERLVVVLNGMKTARDRASEAVKLLSWGFRAFDHKTLFAAGDIVGTAAVYGGASARVPLVAAGAVSLLVPRGSAEPLAGRIVYDGPLPAPVAAGTVVAHLKLSRGGRDILDVPLKTADSVAVGPLPRRALDAGWELVAGFMQTHFSLTQFSLTHVFEGHAPPPRTAQADVANR